MAITPNDTINPTSAESLLQSQVEEVIDAELLLTFEEGKVSVIRHALIYQIYEQHPRFLLSILATYEAAGWKVALYEDDKQGPWLSFSRATTI
jgi:hypothetical protein